MISDPRGYSVESGADGEPLGDLGPGPTGLGESGSSAASAYTGAESVSRLGNAAQAKPALGTQLLRFVVTGGLSAVVDFGLLVALMNLLGFDHNLAKALSFVAGTTTAYLINRRWTFVAEPSKRRFAAVVVLYGVTFVLQVGLFAMLFPWALGVWGSQSVAQVVGFVIAQGVATTVNFIVQRSLIFK